MIIRNMKQQEMQTVDFFGHCVSRLICGGNPLSGYSHVSSELDAEMIEYAEEKGWETDFYMGCFYNLARQYKSAPAVDQDAYAKDHFPADDPHRMTAVIRQVSKPCIAFKVMAASRNCETPEDAQSALRFAFEHIKPGDMVNVGMFQKYKNQVKENAESVREILG